MLGLPKAKNDGSLQIVSKQIKGKDYVNDETEAYERPAGPRS